MRHRGVHVGNFHLVEKEGAEAFTDEEEEILVLFASKAATAHELRVPLTSITGQRRSCGLPRV